MSRISASSKRVRFQAAPLIGAAVVVAGIAPVATATVDTLTTLVGKSNAIGSGAAIGAYGYDPTTDTIYSAAFSGPLLKTTNIDGTQTNTTQVFPTAWLNYLRAGNTNYAGGSPLPGGMLLNPKPIVTASGTLPAYSTAFVIDGDAVLTSGTSPNISSYPAQTQKIYSYNLQTSSVAGGTAADVFTSVMTLQQQMTTAGTTTTTGNLSRQYAWSGDGQSIYFIDTSSALGGLFKESVTGGTPVKLAAVTDNTEPAVTTSNGVDSIYFRGGSTNLGGIDKVTYDGTTASARTTAISAAAIDDFLELPAGTAITTLSMTSDAAGDLFFNDTSNARPGIYEYDTQGRLSKVVTKAERQAYFGSAGTVNANTLRMQTRTITYTNGGSSFPVTQLMYAESSPVNAVAGVDIFSVGDFNRDGSVNQADIALFKPELTVRNVAKTNSDDFKYDLNGDGVVDWKDVKVLQQFYAIPNGDANMDMSVDYTDLNTLYADYGQTNDTWIQGDFTGDNIVNYADLLITAQNFTATPPTISYIESNYTGQFETDALTAFGLVPEPSSVAVVGAGLAMLSGRRRRKG